ncbi:hypothetical protein GYMLUDRAFT_979444 [Collybiopsis luxurians FD-317 M1]|uniref:CNH domain-containing protein n=1 Tax=Collybiopsis luxurians FD-317 M1 TaxID=944289 RepID=A0A0D0BR80_9AGAR|nr:hypothetical protein GYMLUDRAFT_979444 [Collybiopsis luxurians FD-317 M1]
MDTDVGQEKIQIKSDANAEAIANPVAALEEQLVWDRVEKMPLGLREEGRKLLYQGCLSNKRDGKLQVFLLDHVLLFAKVVKTKPKEQVKYKVYRPPIPLELLQITTSEEAGHTVDAEEAQHAAGEVRKALGFFTRTSKTSVNPFWIKFVRLGHQQFDLTLWMSSFEQKEWLRNIHEQQRLICAQSAIFEITAVGQIPSKLKVNCATQFDDGKKMAYGTEDGVYLINSLDAKEEPLKVLALPNVTRIDILEHYQILVVQSERQVLYFPLADLDPARRLAGRKSGECCGWDVTFYTVGYCLGRTLIILVKSGKLSTTVKALQACVEKPFNEIKSFRLFKPLILFRECLIPGEVTSIGFLKTKLWMGNSRGFDILNLETLETQQALDPKDITLEFLSKKGRKPMAMYRVQNDFLLCYNDLAVYVDKMGRRSRRDFMIHWEVFDPSFVEVWDIDAGRLVQVIQISKVRLLFSRNLVPIRDTPANTEESLQNFGMFISSDSSIFSLHRASL